ncbi:MAG: hypothetical protein AAGI23_03280 [Bacteroidota bacterium]
MKKEREHLIEVDFTDEELEQLTRNASALQTNIDRYAIDMVTKGYVLSECIYAEEMYHIQSNPTGEQIINAQLDSALNQIVLAIGVIENFAEELNFFTVLDLLKERLGKDVTACTTFSEWLVKEARSRGAKIN